MSRSRDTADQINRVDSSAANATAITIDSSENVGIGTAAPSFEAGSGGGLEVNHSAGLGSHIKLTDSASGAGGSNGFDLYAFNTSGYIENYEAGSIIFRNNGSARMRIDASGNVLANTSSNSVVGNGGFAIKPQTGNGTRVDISNAGEAMLLDGAASGPIIGLYGNGTSVGSIQTKDSRLFISGSQGSNPAGIYFGGGGDVLPASTTNAVDNSISLGGSGYRFKDLYLSGGVFLGGTGVNNHLHDYEEGLFTVSLALGTGSASLTSNRLFYTKVGRLVTVSGIIRVNSVSGSPNGTLSFNVPFACHTPSTGEDNVRASVQTNIVETGNNNEVMLELLEGAVLVSLFKSGTASLGNAGNILKANTTLGISFSYFTST